MGPMRVLPGRLSVSRTFGDALAKLEQYGGNPRVVVATPDITSFKIQDGVHDFIALASDGIFDKMSTDEAGKCLWQTPAIFKPQHNAGGPPSGSGGVHEMVG